MSILFIFPLIYIFFICLYGRIMRNTYLNVKFNKKYTSKLIVVEVYKYSLFKILVFFLLLFIWMTPFQGPKWKKTYILKFYNFWPFACVITWLNYRKNPEKNIWWPSYSVLTLVLIFFLKNMLPKDWMNETNIICFETNIYIDYILKKCIQKNL